MILLAGIGFEAGMVDKASRELKNILGPMAYIFSGARQFVDQLPFQATMQIDGEQVQIDASAITIANAAPATSVMAQGFGEVIPDDGLLEVIIASPKRPDEWLVCSVKSGLVSPQKQQRQPQQPRLFPNQADSTRAEGGAETCD